MDETQNKEIITGIQMSLSKFLANEKFTVDYFQRGYNWTKDNIQQLVADLIDAFEDCYKDGDKAENTSKYAQYFMGPVVLSTQDGSYSIIDGQQRTTSLTLFLIYLKHLLKEKIKQVYDNGGSCEPTGELTEVDGMIFSSSKGKKSFNIDIPERKDCLSALFENGCYDVKEDDNESVKNMEARYNDIAEVFPLELMDVEKLNAFVYWVIDNVILVRITTTSDKEAYTIFETMNDRGLRLSSVDMIKGYILSKYTDETERSVRNKKWQTEMQELSKYGKDAEVQFFQSWLRAQFAETIRQGKTGSKNQDFENIGMRFHAWFRDNDGKGLLAKSINGNIDSFMKNNYAFYLKYFKKIKDAESTYASATKHIFFTKIWGIADSLKYPLLLASLCTNDTEKTAFAKMDTTAKYIDIFCVRRSINKSFFGQSAIRYTMCSLVKEIRGKSLEDLKIILQKQVGEMQLNFNGLLDYRLKTKNKKFVKYYLARLTSYQEELEGKSSNFVNYMLNPGCKPYEIEHIWADNMDYHGDEFKQLTDFDNWRNKVGALLLLPNGSNQSYGDKTFEDKMPHYIKENVLAKALCPLNYENNPNFMNVIKMGLPFKSYSSFKKADIEDHTKLYIALSNQIWGNV